MGKLQADFIRTVQMANQCLKESRIIILPPGVVQQPFIHLFVFTHVFSIARYDFHQSRFEAVAHFFHEIGPYDRKPVVWRVWAQIAWPLFEAVHLPSVSTDRNVRNVVIYRLILDLDIFCLLWATALLLLCAFFTLFCSCLCACLRAVQGSLVNYTVMSSESSLPSKAVVGFSYEDVFP